MKPFDLQRAGFAPDVFFTCSKCHKHFQNGYRGVIQMLCNRCARGPQVEASREPPQKAVKKAVREKKISP